MFANDFGSHYGTHWNVPNFWGTQNPYFCGYGSTPQNFYGLGNFPYHNNFNHFGTQQNGWNYGQNLPQTTIPQPFQNYNWGFNHQTTPFNYGFNHQTTPFNYGFNHQGFTPYFQNFQHPFQNCR